MGRQSGHYQSIFHSPQIDMFRHPWFIHEINMVRNLSNMSKKGLEFYFFPDLDMGT